jgi:thymidylate synthase
LYIIGENFQTAYRSILDHVYYCGQEVNVRGNDMRECIPGYFEITNPRDRLLNLDSRPNIYKYIFGELMWYLSGRDDVDFISKYSKIWRPLSDDGIHSNSAYGKYIFRDMPVKGWGVTYNSINNFKELYNEKSLFYYR